MADHKTIKDWILAERVFVTRQRITKLTELEAPKMILDKDQELLNDYEQGIIRITDKEQLLDTPYQNHEYTKGRGGVAYIKFNNGSILYFPNAKYGRYITKNKEA
jgi:hypothetical protein